MPTTNLSFAKVVATPTSNSWSQAYNAGSLFIVLSLMSEDKDIQKDIPTLGKQILSNIEAEFFALENKSYETIKQALPQAIKEIPEAITLSLALTYIKDNTLYGYAVSGGRITLKRGEQLGTILHVDETESRDVISASGYLETEDIILLQTAQFALTVPAKTITQAFEYSLPNDIAETLSPHIHGGSEGAVSAIIISFKGPPLTPPLQDTAVVEEEEEPLPTKKEDSLDTTEDEEDEIIPATPQQKSSILPATPEQEVDEEDDEEESPEDSLDTTTSKETTTPQPQPSFSPPREFKNNELDPEEKRSLKDRLPAFSFLNLPRKKKLALGLTVIIAGVLLISIILVLSTREAGKSKALFNEIYSSAKKDYDEGEGLLSLNKSLARDDYASAKAQLEKGRGKFSASSKEGKQLAELEALVDKRLSETEGSVASTAKEIAEKDTPASLRVLTSESSLISSTEDEDGVYTLSSKVITKRSLDLEDNDEVVTNDSTWTKAVSLGVFSGNLYVLDQDKGLIKFVPTSDDYAASTYFKGTAPSLKSAKSMAIDSSIYLLFSDGSVQKYTRGEKDSFSVDGLEKPLSSPQQIFTSAEVSSLYILDPGSSRLVKLDKSGTFQSQYQADILKNANAVAVSNDEQTAYIVSNDKFYSLGL